MADFYKKYPCDKCEKRFRRPAELSRHETTVHQPSPWLVCEEPGCIEQSKHYSSVLRHGINMHGWTKTEAEWAANSAKEKAEEVYELVKELVEQVEQAMEQAVGEGPEMEQDELMEFDVEELVGEDMEQLMEVDVKEELMEQAVEALEQEMEAVEQAMEQAVVDDVEDEVEVKRRVPWWQNEEKEWYQGEEVEERRKMCWLGQEVTILPTIEQQEEPPTEPFSIRTLRDMFNKLNLS